MGGDGRSLGSNVAPGRVGRTRSRYQRPGATPPMTGPARSGRARHGVRNGSWSSPRIPTMRSSGLPPPRPAGSRPAQPDGWSVAPAATRAARTPTPTRLQLAAVRETEQRAAAAIVGYAGVTFLHQPGRRAGERPGLTGVARAGDPDVPSGRRPGHGPGDLFHEGGGVNHTDHRAAGMAAVDAAYPASRNPMAFPWLARSGLGPSGSAASICSGRTGRHTWVDVSATIGRKTRGAGRARQPDQRPAALAARILAWAAEEGEPSGPRPRKPATDRHRR